MNTSPRMELMRLCLGCRSTRSGVFDLGILVLSGVLLAVARSASATEMKEGDMDTLVGQQVDIAPSAYQYRADRKAEENPPESWFALMRYAGLPLNKPVDVNAPAIKQVLHALLWEEIRPVQKLELIWANDARRRPLPEELAVTTLDNKGASSSP